MRQPVQYPAAGLGPGADPRFVWESAATLLVLQASVSYIGPEVLGISVEAKIDEIIVHICLREKNQAVVEDLQDLPAEFDAAQSAVVEPPVRMTIVEYLGDTDPRWPGYPHQRIFLAGDRAR